MSEQNKEIVRRLFEDIWSNGKLPVVDEIIDRSYLNHDPANPDARGPEGYKQLVNKYRTAFPDFRITVDDLLAEGEKVTARFTARGTHKGPLEGIAPTNKSVTLAGMIICRLSGSKIQEAWVNWDAYGLMKQLGVLTIQTQAQGKSAR